MYSNGIFFEPPVQYRKYFKAKVCTMWVHGPLGECRNEVKRRAGWENQTQVVHIYIYIDKTEKTVKMYMCVVSTMCM